MFKNKKFTDWEKNKQVIYLLADKKLLNRKLSEEEFLEIVGTTTVGIDWDNRVKFLKDCGYEVTRENMANADLPFIPKDQRQK